MSFSIDTVNEIIPHLYLTNWKSSNNEKVMEKYKIRGVITIELLDKPLQIIKYYEQNGIQNFHIKLNDTPDDDISKYFDRSYEFINGYINRGENVLVHCRAGISRSATIVINYLLRKKYENEIVTNDPRKVLDDITGYVKVKRSIVNPNYGFMEQLLKYSEMYSKVILWTLSQSDILPSGDLRNGLTSIVIFNVKHTDDLIYEQLSEMLKPHNIKVYIVYGKANYIQYNSDDSPFIVGIYKGKFFSEYGLDPKNLQTYMNIQDLKQFGLEIGTNVNIHEKL